MSLRFLHFACVFIRKLSRLIFLYSTCLDKVIVLPEWSRDQNHTLQCNGTDKYYLLHLSSNLWCSAEPRLSAKTLPTEPRGVLIQVRKKLGYPFVVTYWLICAEIKRVDLFRFTINNLWLHELFLQVPETTWSVF